MSDPFFSIVVPTRQRPDTLVHTIKTIVSQEGSDYEIIIADNFGDEEVKKVILDAQKINPYIRHIRSDKILPMGNNWENGIAACRGRFVTVLGDDDAFLPSTLKRARQLLKNKSVKILNWRTHVYWWPDTIMSWCANRLYCHANRDSLEIRISENVLKAFFDDRLDIGELPMIYNSFVDVELINQIRKKYGNYFMLPELPPDVLSGIFNLNFSDFYLYSYLPLTIRGNSKKSNGTAHFARAYGKEQRFQYYNDEGKTIENLYHPSLIPSPNLHICIANIKLRIKENLFNNSSAINVNLENLVKVIISTLNNEPESYEENLEDARQLAKKIGFDISSIKIPIKESMPVRIPDQGVYENVVVLNCKEAGIYEIASASQLTESLCPVPKYDTFDEDISKFTREFSQRKRSLTKLNQGAGKHD